RGRLAPLPKRPARLYHRGRSIGRRPTWGAEVSKTTLAKRGSSALATFRTEKDSMGPMEVPVDAYYGAQTRRAELNFAISPLRMPRAFIRAMGLIKKAAAHVNMDLGLLDRERGEAISQAAREVAEGKLDDQFVVDVFQ